MCRQFDGSSSSTSWSNKILDHRIRSTTTTTKNEWMNEKKKMRKTIQTHLWLYWIWIWLQDVQCVYNRKKMIKNDQNRVIKIDTFNAIFLFFDRSFAFSFFVTQSIFDWISNKHTHTHTHTHTTERIFINQYVFDIWFFLFSFDHHHHHQIMKRLTDHHDDDNMNVK